MITCKFENGNKASLRHIVADTIVLKDNQVLLVKRAARLLEGGKWGIVGGFLERDETLEQAVHREVMEETGWKVENIKLLEIIDEPNRPNDDRQNVPFVYTCDAVEKVGEPDDESVEQKWFDLDALPSSEQFAFDHLEMIKYYIKNK